MCVCVCVCFSDFTIIDRIVFCLIVNMVIFLFCLKYLQLPQKIKENCLYAPEIQTHVYKVLLIKLFCCSLKNIHQFFVLLGTFIFLQQVSHIFFFVHNCSVCVILFPIVYSLLPHVLGR